MVPIAHWLTEFRRRRPQVVHAWQDSTNLSAVVAALLAGVPRVILCARSVRPDNPRRRLKRFMQEAYQAVLGHPAVVLSNNSRAGADDYARWLGLDPATVEVVYNGIDFDALEASVDLGAARAARASLGIPPDAPVLGSAFRMSEEKRPSLWVEVAGAVARHNPRAHFIVCGDGPERRDMAELALRLGIGDRLHLPGPQANIASWYKAMDVVMLTSRHEGLPNVLLEAQCLGVPVVAPDVGGMSETVWQGVTGWTIKDADAAALAERVLYCLGDPGWRQRAQAAAPPFVKERFGMAAMLRRTLEVYGIAPVRGSMKIARQSWLLLAIAVLMMAGRAASAQHPMPPDVSARVGRAQTFVYRWTADEYKNFLGSRDFIWNNQPGSGQGGVAKLWFPPGTFSGFYIAVSRVPSQGERYGPVVAITACGKPSGGCPLEWFQAHHPNWIVLRHDQATPAYEFNDRKWIPLDIGNPDVQAWIETNWILPVLSAGYQGISIDNVRDQNPFDEEGVCSVAVSCRRLRVERRGLDPALLRPARRRRRLCRQAAGVVKRIDPHRARPQRRDNRQR